MKEKKVRP